MNSEEKLKKLRRAFKPHEKAFIMAAITYMTEEQIADIIDKDVSKIKEYLQIMDQGKIKAQLKELYSEAKLQKWMAGVLPGSKAKKKLGTGSKKNVIGIREDLGLFCRSKMEANTARYLNEIYGRDAWSYECEKFQLSNYRGKPLKYLPDFKLETKDGVVWLEIKGKFWPKDKAKLRKFLKEYPKEKLIMITLSTSKKVVEFCKKNKIEVWHYDKICLEYSDKIKYWE